MSDEPGADDEIPIEERCVLPHAKPTRRDGGLLCRRHYHWLNNTLDEMVELYSLLSRGSLTSTGGDGRHGTSVEAPAPGNLNVIAITERTERGGAAREVGDELWYEAPDIPAVVPALSSWVLTIHEERDITPPVWDPTRALWPTCANPKCHHGTCVYLRADSQPVTLDDYTFHGGRWRLRTDLVTVVRILRRHRLWIAGRLWVDDYVNELASLHRALATAAGDTMWPQSIGKCPNCTASLYNTVGIDEVTCRKCRSAWTGVALVRLRLILEQEEAQRGKESVGHEPPPAEAVRVDDAGDTGSDRGDAAPTPGPGQSPRPTRRVRRLESA